MDRRIARVVLLAGAFLAAGAAAAHAQAPRSLEREIPRLMELGDVPGLSIAVIENRRVVWVGAYGTLGDSAGTPVNDETIFSAASLSKPLFAYVVLRLVDRGELDLDEPLAEWLPFERLAHDERYVRITARMVLSHGTGLPNWGGGRLTLRFDPGTGFDYSGEGFVYLQRTVESVTGQSLEALARREVFEPLGMARSSYVWQERFEGNAVYGRDGAWRAEHVNRYQEPNAAFSLLTTADDYARFMTAVLTGAGLSEASRRALLTPVRSAHRPWRPSAADTAISWSLGWGLQKGGAGTALWHWGDNGRFKAYVVAYPETGRGVVYLANAQDGLAIAQPIVNAVIADDHAALDWLDYGRVDDPRRLAARTVKRAALDAGADAAQAQFARTRADPATRLDLRAANELAAFLTEHGFERVAHTVASAAVEDFPDSIRAYDNLAERLLAAGEYEQAIDLHRRSLAIDADRAQTRERIAWIEQRIAAREHPVVVPIETLRQYVGRYGARHVRLSGATLFYRRDGNREYRLIPLAHDLFALDGLETFRVRFVRESPGPAGSIEGLYIDGASDETVRTDSRSAGPAPRRDPVSRIPSCPRPAIACAVPPQLGFLPGAATIPEWIRAQRIDARVRPDLQAGPIARASHVE